MATYNRAHYLPDALDSLVSQTRRPDEIIIVDDGSTDNTAEVVARYGTNVRYLKQRENGGKSAALNYGIPLAVGSHIWIFDDDDVALPDTLQSHIEFLATHADVDFCYSTNYRYSGNDSIWQPHKWVTKTIPDWSSSVFPIQVMKGLQTLLQGMLIPKRCLLEVGLFDPDLRRAQDTDILIRLAHRFKARNIQKPTFILRDHSGARWPRVHRYNAVRRNAVQLHYQQQVFRKLRDKYPLAAFLPHEPGEAFPRLNEVESAQALIQRGCIMLRQGLVDEALHDLTQGLNSLAGSDLPGASVSLLLSQAIDTDPRRFLHPFSLILRLSEITKKAGHSNLAFSLARGLYWSFTRAMRQHAYYQAAVTAVMLCLAILRNPVLVFKHRNNMAS